MESGGFAPLLLGVSFSPVALASAVIKDAANIYYVLGVGTVPGPNNNNWALFLLLSLDCHARLEFYIIICHITCRGDTCYHVCATWVPQIIGAVPGIQHGESRVTTVGPYSPNVAMSID